MAKDRALRPTLSEMTDGEEITDRLKEQLKAVRTEVKDSDADYPHIAQIISHHRNGGEAEAIRISHEVAANPVNAKETSDNEKNK